MNNGWGSWTGIGSKGPSWHKKQRINKKKLIQQNKKKDYIRTRKDFGLNHVIINQVFKQN